MGRAVTTFKSTENQLFKNVADVSPLRYSAGYLAPILLHRAIDFSLGIAIALGIALVVLFLSFCQTDFAFDAATLIMQIQW